VFALLFPAEVLRDALTSGSPKLQAPRKVARKLFRGGCQIANHLIRGDGWNPNTGFICYLKCRPTEIKADHRAPSSHRLYAHPSAGFVQGWMQQHIRTQPAFLAPAT